MALTFTNPPTTARRRGRPLGSQYDDRASLEAMRQLIEPTPSVASLRVAAACVAPSARNYGHSNLESIIRRLCQRYRGWRST